MILENKDFKIIIGKNLPETEAAPAPVEEDKQELLYKISKILSDGGFNPVSQLVGYLISDDPTHISNINNARTQMNHIDRGELLEDIVKTYLDMLEEKYGSDDGENDED